MIVHDRAWQPKTLRQALLYIRDELNIQLVTLDQLRKTVEAVGITHENSESRED